MSDLPVSIAQSLKTQWHYQLIRGGIVLADLRSVDDWRHAEYPCIEGSFSPTTAYETVRTLFDRERSLLDSEDDEHIDEWATSGTL